MKELIEKLSESESKNLKVILIGLESYIADIRNKIDVADSTRHELIKLIDEQIIAKIDIKNKVYKEEETQEFV